MPEIMVATTPIGTNKSPTKTRTIKYKSQMLAKSFDSRFGTKGISTFEASQKNGYATKTASKDKMIETTPSLTFLETFLKTERYIFF